MGPPPGTSSPAWRSLARRASACRACPLGSTRQHAVFYRGGTHPRVLLVGEAPGRDEDAAGLPFVGRAGRRLEAGVLSLGVSPEQLGFVNVLKCRPPENRFPPSSVAPCAPFLEGQIQLLGPERLVSLGAHALRLLDPAAPPILRAAGIPRRAGAYPLFPLLHPAAPLHAPRLRPRWEGDLSRLGRWLDRPADETL